MTGGDHPRPRAVLFDWDSTLVDNWAGIVAAMNATLIAMGHEPWSEAEARARIRESMRNSFPRLFGDRWEEAREVFYDAYTACHLDSLKALPGAAEMLARLAERGLYLGVVSNKTGALLRRESSHLGWDSFFGRLVGATDAERDKPDPAPVRMALAGSGLSPGSDVLFVGDTGVDMHCALNAGCVPVLIGGCGTRETEFADCSPRYRVENCAELASLVCRLTAPHMVD